MYLTDHELYWYWLASTPRIGLKTMLHLLSAHVPLEELFLDQNHAAFQGARIRKDTKDILKERADKDILYEELYGYEKEGIRVTTMLSNDYPALLKETIGPPTLLYVKGDLMRLTEKRIAMVGSRRASRRGLAEARKIAKELAEAGVSVISGMARGVDTAAHEGALEGKGITVAVLGCGVDIIYPRESFALYEKIVETGAVISEYKPGAPPLAGNFPLRNRIMSGIAEGVIVGDAGLKSGAHITVRLACEENRDVFAIPTGSGLETSILPNLLLAEGAPVCQDARDVLAYYNWGILEGEAEASLPEGLDFSETELYNLLLQGDLDVQALIAYTKKSAAEINLTLTKLELKGLVERLAGNMFGIKTLT